MIIDLEQINCYGQIPIDRLPLEDKVLVRNESSMTVKKRIRSMIIFNPDKYPCIHIRMDCNIKIPNSGISADDAQVSRDGNALLFAFQRCDLSFHKIEVTDAVNAIKYIFRICIVDLPTAFMAEEIKRNFVVNWRKTKAKSSIKLLDVGSDLVFHAKGKENVSQKLEDHEEYRCNYGERLHLYMPEEELINYGNGINITINFAGIVIPFTLFPDETNKIEINGKKS